MPGVLPPSQRLFLQPQVRLRRGLVALGHGDLVRLLLCNRADEGLDREHRVLNQHHSHPQFVLLVPAEQYREVSHSTKQAGKNERRPYRPAMSSTPPSNWLS